MPLISSYPTINPSLAVDFSNTEQIDPIVAYSRASSGTYTNMAGVLTTAASGQPRFTYDGTTGECLGMYVEPQATNLVLSSSVYDQQNLFSYSGTFDNAAWTKSRVTVTGGYSDPFGGTNAYKLAEDSSSNSHQMTQTAGVGNSPAYILSFYAKAAERSWVATWVNAAATCIAYFDLANGVVGSIGGTIPPTSTSITSVGSGWYRCVVNYQPAVSVPGISIATSTGDGTIVYTGTTGSGIYVYGAQVERTLSTTPTAYYPTTSAAWIPWVEVQSYVIPASGVAPDGTNSAYKIAAASGQSLASASTYFRTSSFTTVSGTTYTVSAYAKSAGFNRLLLRIGNSNLNTVYGVCSFDLDRGSVIGSPTGFNATIQSAGNGWYRCSISAVCDTTTTYAGIWNADTVATVGDGTSGILLWGYQVETGTTATTYIATTTSQVTRAADTMVVNAPNVISATEGSVFVDGYLTRLNANQTLFAVDNGTSEVAVKTLAQTNGTNILTYTEQVSRTSTWTNGGFLTMTSNAGVAPDGTLTATQLIANAGQVSTQAGCSSYTNAFTTVIGTDYTFSCYIKGVGYTSAMMIISTSTSSPNSGTATRGTYSFDLVGAGTATLRSEVAGSNSAGFITNVGNGWYRCSIKFTAAVTTTARAFLFPTVFATTTDGTSGALFWGTQWEQSSSPTAYEPNPKFATTYDVGGTGAVTTTSFGSTAYANQRKRIAVAYTANDDVMCRDGSVIGTSPSVTVPATLNRITIGGSTINSGREMNGIIKRLAYYPRRVTTDAVDSLSS